MALMITYTILGVPYKSKKNRGPQSPILIIKAPTSGCWGLRARAAYSRRQDLGYCRNRRSEFRG